MKKIVFFIILLFILLISIGAQDRGDILKPVKIFSDVKGVRGEEYDKCMDNNLSTCWKPDIAVDKVQMKLQIYFDSNVMITGMELAQGYTNQYLKDAPYRIKEIIIYYPDGLSQKVKIKDSTEPNYYKLKKNRTYFMEILFSSYYPNREGWYFLLRELKFYGSPGTEKIESKDTSITYKDYIKKIDDIFYYGNNDNFSDFNNIVIWRVNPIKLTTEYGDANPQFYGGELDSDGYLIEDYYAYVFFDNPDRSNYATFDARIKFKNRLEWTKAKHCYDNGITYKVKGNLLKPIGADKIVLDNVIVAEPELKNIKEETLPVSDVIYNEYVVYDLEYEIMDRLDLPFYVYKSEKTERKNSKKNVTFSMILGRPGLLPGEWQSPIDYYEKEIPDYEELCVKTALFAGEKISQGKLICDIVILGYKFKYFTITSETARKMYQMDKDGEDYYEIQKFYEKNMRLN